MSIVMVSKKQTDEKKKGQRYEITFYSNSLLQF